MQSFQFDNAFVRELPADPARGPQRRQVHGALYSHVMPTPVAAPRLLAYSREMAELLGLSKDDLEAPEFARVFGGNALTEGMQPYAANYGGHQFGHWAGQLGDGRAISLGEVLNAAGQRWELQLKGAGPTPYSRTADGRAVLRSSVREFLCSEAMHHLGVPTTRALCLVTTGDLVVRDMFYDGNPEHEPGAIVCRVSPSFIRFGNFELPAARDDQPLLNQLIDFTVRRDFPELLPAPAAPVTAALRAAWFAQVCERTARLMAHWMRVGFVHGVMNTDNMSILGLTIDYGPYGWVDNFDLDWTPNTTDAEHRRYRFGQQPQIAFWNLNRLAVALAPVFPSTELLEAGLNLFIATYRACERDNISAKLGLGKYQEDDADLMNELYGLMQSAEADMTLFFRGLMDLDMSAPNVEPLKQAFYDADKRRAAEPDLLRWLRRYAARAAQDPWSDRQRRESMRTANPRYVLRNYLAQIAIDRAQEGDSSAVDELLEVLRRPYDDQPAYARYAERRPDWARTKPGCSMLSCSS